MQTQFTHTILVNAPGDPEQGEVTLAVVYEQGQRVLAYAHGVTFLPSAFYVLTPEMATRIRENARLET